MSELECCGRKFYHLRYFREHADLVHNVPLSQTSWGKEEDIKSLYNGTNNEVFYDKYNKKLPYFSSRVYRIEYIKNSSYNSDTVINIERGKTYKGSWSNMKMETFICCGLEHHVSMYNVYKIICNKCGKILFERWAI